MFINKTTDGRNNLCGEKVASLRSKMGISQRALAEKFQIAGLDIDKNAVQRIECGKRFVTDIELKVIAEVFKISVDELLN